MVYYLKEHIPRKGKDNISEEGQDLLEDIDVIRQPYSRNPMSPERGRELTKTGSFIHVPPEKANYVNLYHRSNVT